MPRMYQQRLNTRRLNIAASMVRRGYSVRHAAESQKLDLKQLKAHLDMIGVPYHDEEEQ